MTETDKQHLDWQQDRSASEWWIESSNIITSLPLRRASGVKMQDKIMQDKIRLQCDYSYSIRHSDKKEPTFINTPQIIVTQMINPEALYWHYFIKSYIASLHTFMLTFNLACPLEFHAFLISFFCYMHSIWKLSSFSITTYHDLLFFSYRSEVICNLRDWSQVSRCDIHTHELDTCKVV